MGSSGATTTPPLATLDGRYGRIAQVAPSVQLANPRGLRRFAYAVNDALFDRVPVAVVGDSTVYGIGGDNINAANNTVDAVAGWVGQLRSLFAKTYGDPGEGLIFWGDSRISTTGATAGNWLYGGPLRHGIRLLSGQTYTLASVPAGVTTVGVVQANLAGDSAGTYSRNGGASTGLTALTGTNTSIATDITVVAGDSLVISGPASGQTYIVGLNLKAAATGVPVHRVGVTGYVAADPLGGQTNGTMTLSAANQAIAVKKTYDLHPRPGLLIVTYGVNDQQYQASGGNSNQTGVNTTLYRSCLQTICAQAVTDGWCVLLLGQQASPTAATTGDSEAAYRAARNGIATTTDHVAAMEISDLWGTSPAVPVAAGLQFANSPHTTRIGHGTIARLVHRAITTVYGETAPTA